MNSNTFIITTTDHDLFKSLKYILSSGTFADILFKQHNISPDSIIPANSVDSVKSIVSSCRIGLMLADLDEGNELGMELIRELRRSHYKFPIICMSFIYLDRLLDDPENSILQHKGHYYIGKPYILKEFESQIKNAESLTDTEVNEIAYKCCTVMGVFESLLTNNKNGQVKKSINVMLKRHLALYPDLLKDANEESLNGFADSVSHALESEAFRMDFHNDIYTKAGQCRSEIQSYVRGLDSNTNDIIETISAKDWWSNLENQMNEIDQQFEQSSIFKPSMEFYESKSALKKWKDFVSFILEKPSENIITECRQAVSALDIIKRNLNLIDRRRKYKNKEIGQ